MGKDKGKGEVVSEIRAALDNHELKAYYQPQYDAITNKLVGAEALVRWIKPDGSVIMPGNFIPQMEEDNTILVLDWYILREVCAFLKKQREEGIYSVPVAVNFSRRHVYEDDFVEQLCVQSRKFLHH